MHVPLRWLRNPKHLSDDRLVIDLEVTLLQLRNDEWRRDPEALAWLEGKLGAQLAELERRIAQGTLF